MSLVDARHGWAVGTNGTIVATADGGAPWSTQNSGTDESLFAVSFTDPDHGWVVGGYGTILATTCGGEPPLPETCTITPSVLGGHGTISPSTPQTVATGATPTFTFTPDPGYRLADVRVDGTPVSPTAVNAYTFPPVRADHAISVAFSENPAPSVGTPSCPRSVRKAASFTVFGTLSPWFPPGAKTVTLTAYRLVKGRWMRYRTCAAVNADAGGATRYRARMRIAAAGTYRFRASTAATAVWQAATSGFSRKMTVR